MTAKRDLLLREREYLIDEVTRTQQEHAEVMKAQRMAEHAFCVTEMEVERRATMMLHRHNQEISDLRHAIEVFDEINRADQQRHSMVLRDVRHAEAILEEEAHYAEDLHADLLELVKDVAFAAEDCAAEEAQSAEDLSILGNGLLNARFALSVADTKLRIDAGHRADEASDKVDFEQHLFSNAIDKLRALEDERARIIKGFMRKSAEDDPATLTEGGEAPVLHAIITTGAEPSFAERARRLADQRYPTLDGEGHQTLSYDDMYDDEPSIAIASQDGPSEQQITTVEQPTTITTGTQSPDRPSRHGDVTQTSESDPSSSSPRRPVIRLTPAPRLTSRTYHSNVIRH